MKDTDEILTMVLERFFASGSSRGNREIAWNRAYQHYRGNTGCDEEKYFIPETYSAVETILPRLTGDFLNSSTSMVTVQGRNPGDQTRARMIEGLLSYEFQVDGVACKLVDFYRQALIYGTAVGKVCWSHRTRQRKYITSNDNRFGIKSAVYREEEQVVQDDPTFEVVPIYDFYIDPAATGIEDARYCVQRKMMTRHEIEEQAEQGVYDPKSLEDLPEEGAGFTEDDGKETDRSYSQGTSDYADSAVPQKFEILEYWEDNRVVVIADRAYVLRDEENPFWHGEKPFVLATYQSVPFEIYGLGIPEIVEDIQKILNDLANSRLDNIKLIVNRMWLMSQGSVNPDDLVSKPGKIITVNKGDFDSCLRPLVPPDISSSVYQEENVLRRAIQEMTGVNEYVRGSVSDLVTRQTATEINMKTQQAATRFEFNFKLLAEQSIMKIAKFFLALLQQYMEKDRMIRILDTCEPAFVMISPLDIQGDFDFKMSVDPTHSDEQQRIDKLIRLFGLVAGDPSLSQVKMNLLRKLIEAFDFDPVEIMGGMENGLQNGPVQQGMVPGGEPDLLGRMAGIPETLPADSAGTGNDLPPDLPPG